MRLDCPTLVFIIVFTLVLAVGLYFEVRGRRRHREIERLVDQYLKRKGLKK